ncbi:MAG: LysR family transcriptional regulator [Rhodospirillales bacterium RIFCSPLOWO2_12_FULL_58_28]|nr:MAG: LysR family transcriptional regulator [Rhodospirillales bacterium RIFCSPLOWO2_02_FULL_58_16]OHC76949.1 MAG: LysR family transcriptional regulator [Rhodospirillales bacterium RIFCSPLOWO2_12_FULL_58_28]
MDWDKLRIFHVVAEAGSFTHAGDTLNLSQSAVSRQVGALEKSLNVTLFHRHARGLILTEQGDLLYRTAQEIFTKLTRTKARLCENTERPQGPLKITTTVAFGSVWLTPRIKEFLEMYPDIKVSLVLADNELDIAMREADVAIRMTKPHQPDLIRRRLMTMHYRVFATIEYLNKHGTPKTVEDLDNHNLIVYGEDSPPAADLNWLLEVGRKAGDKRNAILKVNSIYGIFLAVQKGLGIGGLPDYMSRESGDLIELLPEIRGPSYDTFFVYPEELRHSQRIGAFRDFLVKRIAKDGL